MSLSGFRLYSAYLSKGFIMPVTHNNPDCTCGRDHDGIEHFMIKMVNANLDGYLSHLDFPANLVKLALETGWSHDTDGPEDLFDIVEFEISASLLADGTLGDLIDATVAAVHAAGWTHPTAHPKES